MDDERLLRVLAGNHLDRPRISADGDDFLADQPFRRVLADPGLAGVVGGVLGGVLLEEIAPPRVDDHDVALAERGVVHPEPRLNIGSRDQGAFVQARLLAGGVRLELPSLLEDLDRIDQYAPGRE